MEYRVVTFVDDGQEIGDWKECSLLPFLRDMMSHYLLKHDLTVEFRHV